MGTMLYNHRKIDLRAYELQKRIARSHLQRAKSYRCNHYHKGAYKRAEAEMSNLILMARALRIII